MSKSLAFAVKNAKMKFPDKVQFIIDDLKF